MQKIMPCLWFDTQALEAAKFYASIFKRSKVGDVTYYGEGAPMPEGTVLTVEFKLEGQSFLALNGGPVYKHTPALSLMVDCADQKEIDALWAKLTAGGGEPGPCGWLTDKYGVSWQIVPRFMMKAIKDKNRARTKRVMDAMMQMGKLDLAALQKAYKG